jgi:hypothetical protein
MLNKNLFFLVLFSLINSCQANPYIDGDTKDLTKPLVFFDHYKKKQGLPIEILFNATLILLKKRNIVQVYNWYNKYESIRISRSISKISFLDPWFFQHHVKKIFI